MAEPKPATSQASSPEAAQPDHSETMPDFETTLSQIETVVRDLEGGELSLDDSLRQYESAVGKMRQCYRLLEVAERRVSILSGFDAEGNPVTEVLEDQGGGSGSDAGTLMEKQKSRGQRRGIASTGRVDEDTED